MGTDTPNLGLILTADLSAWDATWSKATQGVQKLAKEVNTATKGMEESKKAVDRMAKGLEEAGKQAEKLGGASTWSSAVTGANQFLEILSKVGAVINEGVELAHFASEVENLGKRVPVERLRMMQEATEGAVSKIDLMKFSMRAMAGEAALTEKGLNKILRAANTLSDEGFGDTMEIANRLDEALRKGVSKGLRDLGVELVDTKDKTANVNKMLEKFTELANKEVNVEPQLKAVERLQARIKDWTNDWKKDIGDILAMLAVGLEAYAEREEAKRNEGNTQRNVVSHRQEALTSANKAFRLTHGGRGFNPSGDSDDWDIARQQKEAGEFRALFLQALQQQAASDVQRSNQTQLLLVALGLNAANTAKAAGYGKDITNPPKSAPGPVKPNNWLAPYFERGAMELNAAMVRGADMLPGWLDRVPMQYGQSANERIADNFFGGAAQGGLDTIAGSEKLNKFGAALNDNTTALGGTFNALTSGMAAAVEAAVSGSESIGAAFKKASAMALKSLAIESTVRAAYEIAMGLAAIAIPGAQVSAGAHFAAAAQYALVAALAGAGSAALGGGNTGAGRASAGGSPSTAAGGGGLRDHRLDQSSSGSGGIVIYVGDGFVGKPAELAGEIENKLRGGARSGTVRITPGAASMK